MSTVDFTREPIIETIITPKEGHKLVIRSSTSTGQEEYFVDAAEIVTFGNAQFFRSLERPKAFLVPVSDYEILEVREARMVLKNAGLDRSIKIGGGREGAYKAPKEVEKETSTEFEGETEEVAGDSEVTATEARTELKIDKKRDRKRHYRKRRGKEEKEEGEKEAATPVTQPHPEEENGEARPHDAETPKEGVTTLSPSALSALLQPPPTLISETINRYRQDETFKGAFYLTEEELYKPHDQVQELLNEEDEEETTRLQEPSFSSEEAKEEHEIAGLSFESEEDSILHSRLPLVPKEEKDAAEMPAESSYEPTEKPPKEEEIKPKQAK